MLLSKSQRGAAAGIAYICVGPGFDYEVGLSGLARQYPTHTRGMVAALDDLLRDLNEGNL